MVDVGSLFNLLGGEPAFERLVERFYEGVENDPILRPLYPDDLGEPRRHLTLFLIQLTGGPQRYSAERGHPRLRMRHFRFRIDKQVRDAWIRQMNAALAGGDLPDAARDELERYFADAATFLMNT